MFTVWILKVSIVFCLLSLVAGGELDGDKQVAQPGQCKHSHAGSQDKVANSG